MAQFNIDASLSSGKRLQWLAIADEGESLHSVADQVKRAAGKKFGPAVMLNRWSVMRASNGCITVTMNA
ncbi:hypothetical protein [Stutzerimonas stutzeri]|uniref:hypothetical protein n=1 Tax=Stutzerimonas stutzeri TaxID=316 RepID=UPI00244B618C|nr:hypothetical protein [Stutzerimonas stutzeri]MDH0157324.1 hypothetical protein [Stutzerimonas stutzeri]